MDALEEWKQIDLGFLFVVSCLIALFALVWNWSWIASNLRRALGGRPPIWQEQGALLHVSYDPQGFVDGVIYAGGEGERSNARFWVRCWQRGRGILWQVPGSADNKRFALIEGVLVVPTESKRLVGLDIDSGKPRWEHRVSDYVKKGPSRTPEGLVYLFKDGAWLCVQPASGKLIASGKLTSTADEAALFAGAQPVLDGVYEGGLSDAGIWGRDELRVRLRQPLLLGRLGIDEKSYESHALTVGVFREQAGAHEDEQRYPPEPDAAAYSVKAKKPPALDWQEELTPLRGKELRIDAGQWFGRAYAASMHNVPTPRLGESSCVLWLVDFEGRRLLMQIGERLDSWVMGPTGRVATRF